MLSIDVKTKKTPGYMVQVDFYLELKPYLHTFTFPFCLLIPLKALSSLSRWAQANSGNNLFAVSLGIVQASSEVGVSVFSHQNPFFFC